MVFLPICILSLFSHHLETLTDSSKPPWRLLLGGFLVYAVCVHHLRKEYFSCSSLTALCASLVPMMVPKTTAETLKHKINPSLELAAPQAVDVLLYTPGRYTHAHAKTHCYRAVLRLRHVLFHSLGNSSCFSRDSDMMLTLT